MTAITAAKIRELRDHFPELRGLDDSSIDDRLIADIEYNRAKARDQFAANLPALNAQAQAAYDAEMARYKSANPSGKNGRKAAMRAARSVWSGFGRSAS